MRKHALIKSILWCAILATSIVMTVPITAHMESYIMASTDFSFAWEVPSGKPFAVIMLNILPGGVQKRELTAEITFENPPDNLSHVILTDGHTVAYARFYRTRADRVSIFVDAENIASMERNSSLYLVFVGTAYKGD